MLASSQDLPNQESPPKLFSSGSFRELRERAGTPDQHFGNVKGGRSGYRGVAPKLTLKGQLYTLVILQSLHPQNAMLVEVQATVALVISIAIIFARLRGGS